MILELFTKGSASEEIIEGCPQLETDGLRAALLYAHHISGNPLLSMTRIEQNGGWAKLLSRICQE